MIIVDKLSYSSKLRTVNASVKFAFAMLTLFFCIVSRSIVIAGLVLVSTGILTVYKGGIPLSRYIRLLCVPLVFLGLSVAAILLEFPRSPLGEGSVYVGFFYVGISNSGLWEGTKLLATALSSVSCLYFLALSTPMTDILWVLRKIHCPDLLLELMLLIYRFIFVLLDLAKQMQIAQKSRLSNRSFQSSIYAMGALMSTLFVRAFKRSNELYDAMEARGYDGKIRVLTPQYAVRKRVILYLMSYESILLLLWLGRVF